MFQSILQETLAEENWQEVQKLGGTNIPALFPLAVIEEHGPHLPLGADIYWSCGSGIPFGVVRRGGRFGTRPPGYPCRRF